MLTRAILSSSAAAVALLCCLAAPAAQAQAQAQEQADGDAPTRASEDIVVTAQKREESLQSVPISIAAFSGTALKEANIDTLIDLRRIAPSFIAVRAGQVSGVRLNIRGVGAGGSTAIEPSVATFVDGVYLPRPGALFGRLYDVQAVEVLRGPQGTLFGRNASVGAVSLRTATPTDRFEGFVQGELGSYGQRAVDGAVNLPVSDAIAVRVAGTSSAFGGYARTAVGDHRFGNQRSYGGRLSVSIKPADALTWILRTDYLKMKGDGWTQIELLPGTVPAAQRAAFAARLGGVLPDLTDPFDRRSNQYISGDLDDRQWGAASDLSYEFGSGFTLRMINSYREWKNDQRDADLFYTPLPLLQRRTAYDSRSQNHELQLVSPSDTLLGGRLDFVAGLYYFKEDFDVGERLDFLSQFCPVVVRVAAPSLVGACRTGVQNDATVLDFRQRTKSYAAYGQATFALADRLDLTLGARYSHDDKSGSFDQTVNNPVGVLLRAREASPLAFKQGKLTYRTNLAWRPTDHLMLFATYATGFKSGGFNSSGGAGALLGRRTFDSETVKDYEIGAKSSWLDGAFVLNLTGFRMDIDGFQDRSLDGTSFVVRNAGSLRQQGVEIESIIRPDHRFRFNIGLTILDSKFTDYRGAPGLPGFGGSQDMTGAPNNYSPDFQGTVGAQYDGEISAAVGWSIRGDLSFQSDSFIGASSDGNPQTTQDGYATLGLRLALHDADDRWTIAAVGQNLTKTNYCTTIFTQPIDNIFGLRDPVSGGSGQRCIVGAPRTFAVQGQVRF